jgi:Flp pilus assembly protein CpaB
VDHFVPEDHGGTVRLLQGVKVLATDSRMDAAPPPATDAKIIDNHEMRSITLLVTPKEAQILADAQRRGTLTLLLRKPGDTTVYPADVVTQADLKFPEPRKQETPVAEKKVELPPPPPPAIRFSRGSQPEALPAPPPAP